MSVLLLGDLHLGNHKWEGGELIGGVNRRCRELLAAIRETVDTARRLSPGLSAVIQVGDFFDQSRPDPAVVHAALELMKSYPLDWHLMAGNHDLRAFGAPSALAPLSHVPGIFVYEQPAAIELMGMRFALVPYISHSALSALEMSRSVLQGADIVAMHYGVVSTPSRPDQITGPGVLRFCGPKANGIQVFSGHEHGERSVYSSSRYVGLGSFADLDWSSVWFATPGSALLHRDGTVTPIATTGPHFSPTTTYGDPRVWQRYALSSALNYRGRGLYLEVPAEAVGFTQVLYNLGLIQGWRLQPSVAAPVVEAPTTERNGFGDLESPIAEVLDARGEDLSDESTHRVWSRCLAHMKEQ